METLIWTGPGLGQYYIRLDYIGVGRRAASRTWQKLCQREDTGLPWGKPYSGRIHIWDYPKGNQAIRTPSPVQGLTGDPGELTPVLGLASDCSAQSDCRGCLEDSTRVHHPGNWTGREKGARIPGWGGMAQQAWHRPVLPAPLPVTQHTGRNWIDAEIVESCEGVRCRPARSSADVCQRGAVRQRMGGGNTPGGVSPHPQGARLALRLVRQGDGLHYPVGQPGPKRAQGEASETVSVVPHSCLWRNSGSSALLGHVPPWGVPSYTPSLTSHREKRFSACGRACSFPSWPEAPTGWGAGAPSPCSRSSALWIGLG